MADHAHTGEHHDHHGKIVPEPMLYAMGALVFCVLAFVTFAKVTGIGVAKQTEFTSAETLSLTFADESDGAVGVYDAETGAQIHLYPAGEGGFVRTAMRALTFDRDKYGIGQTPPFTLTRTTEGILLLEDPSTGRRVALEAFSKGSAANFDQLFEAGDAA
ncbi:MAG: photosynthetic complex assembly protein PuhC [Pseudomonadota bacterium]